MRIIEDLSAYSNKKISKCISTLLFNPCFHSILLYRIACFFSKWNITILAKIIWYINRVIFNVDLDFRSDIGGGFRLIHGLGVVIGSEVRAGKNLTVYQGVTLGGNFGKKKEIDGKITGQPYIGDNVMICTDSKLFGPIFVPNGTLIKAGRLISNESDL